jgi:DNA-binding beta-propeller fold protein YncE
MFARIVRPGAVLAFIAFSLSGVPAAAQTVPPQMANPVAKIAKIPIPGKPMRSFDISWVDAPSARYYLADRTNASIWVVDTNSNSVVSQIGGFKGATSSSKTSGPDGIVVTFSGKELWAGDGDSTVKVVDLTSGQIVANISTGGKFRADELAYDPKENVILIANDADDPPYLSFISVGSRSVVKKVEFPNATDGLEQPVYDPVTGMFYQAVPATKANKGGEVAVLDPVKMSVVTSYPLINCVPHGMAVGPFNQLLVGCSVTGRNIIIDRTNGLTLADFSDNGGGDESWYNPGDNRYYTAQSAAQNLGIIDAATFAGWTLQAGVGSHSVAADQVLNHIFVPVAAPDPACPNGCIAVYAPIGGDMQGVSRLR